MLTDIDHIIKHIEEVISESERKDNEESSSLTEETIIKDCLESLNINEQEFICLNQVVYNYNNNIINYSLIKELSDLISNNKDLYKFKKLINFIAHEFDRYEIHNQILRDEQSKNRKEIVKDFFNILDVSTENNNSISSIRSLLEKGGSLFQESITAQVFSWTHYKDTTTAGRQIKRILKNTVETGFVKNLFNQFDLENLDIVTYIIQWHEAYNNYNSSNKEKKGLTESSNMSGKDSYFLYELQSSTFDLQNLLSLFIFCNQLKKLSPYDNAETVVGELQTFFCKTKFPTATPSKCKEYSSADECVNLLRETIFLAADLDDLQGKAVTISEDSKSVDVTTQSYEKNHKRSSSLHKSSRRVRVMSGSFSRHGSRASSIGKLISSFGK